MSLNKVVDTLINNIANRLNKNKDLTLEEDLKNEANLDLLRLFTLCKSSGYNTVQEVYDTLTSFKNVFGGATEMRALTSMMSINQGVKNLPSSLVYVQQNFSRALKERLTTKGWLKTPPTEPEYQKLLRQAAKEGIIIENNGSYFFSQIDLRKFVRNRAYKKLVIDLYDAVKDTFNVYACIDSLPHYKALFAGVADADYKMRIGAGKYRLMTTALPRVARFLQQPENSIKGAVVYRSAMVDLSEERLNKLTRLYDDTYTYRWLNKIAQEKNLNDINLAQVYYRAFANDPNLQLKTEMFDLSTPEGMQEAKAAFEVLIMQVLKQDPAFANNKFVQKLTTYVTRDGEQSWIKLSINSKELSEAYSQSLEGEVSEGLSELFLRQAPLQTSLGQMPLTWGEVLWLYNTLATRNAFGPNFMTVWFQNATIKNSFVQSYYDGMNEFDREIAKSGGEEELFPIKNIIFALYENNGVVEYSSGNADDADFSAEYIDFDESAPDVDTEEGESDAEEKVVSENRRLENTTSLRYFNVNSFVDTAPSNKVKRDSIVALVADLVHQGRLQVLYNCN
jgi:hypothetical protein